MFEVIPNWHPIFVHFAIALLSMSSVFFVLLKVLKNHPVKEQLRILAYWNLWLGTGFAVVTAIAGWFAYNSVAHDTASHIAMTEHRNWAKSTVSVFFIISIWSVKLYKNRQGENFMFTAIMVFAFVLLASTGERGSEAVYRYGLGVMSRPKVEGEGHAHEHADGQKHHDTIPAPVKEKSKKEEAKQDVHRGPDHET